MTQSLRDLIATNFAGLERYKLKFFSPYDMPCTQWPFVIAGSVKDFSIAESFEEIPLRTWETELGEGGLYAVLWKGEFLALTYRAFGDSVTRWTFANAEGEARMMKAWLLFQKAGGAPCPVLPEDHDVLDLLIDASVKMDRETGSNFLKPHNPMPSAHAHS